MYALADVNSFYASCEVAWRPDLQGKPVVVLSNNDGCVIALSAEAKKLKIKMGAPYFKQRALFQQHNVVVFSSNYELYGDMSHRVMETLGALCPKIEIYSIDEAFLDLSRLPGDLDLESFGKEIRDTVKQHTRLTIGVGIAPTKTLAKLANFAAKKWTKSQGVIDLSDPVRQKKLMSYVPVEEVWGVGRRISKKLNDAGIKTALQLAECDLWFIRKNFNVVMERTVRELRGEPCLGFDEFAPAKQEIVCSRSFGTRVTAYQEMREAICYYATRASEKLRAEHQFCRQISVFVKTSPFAEGEIYYGNLASTRLITPTQDTRDIIFAATKCLDDVWKEGHRYQKAGVMLGDFFSQGVSQLHLFDERAPRANSDALMTLFDEINDKGKGTLWFAGQGISRDWQMKREMLSPAWTTRLSDVPVARA
ncbi:DNA polymerase V [Rahnella sp. BIGb0603]|jgi:DNA polymerase V|uniref:translesion error-prone DNA polymerase V subunit UmuC n=1 Tax=Rahnella sp. BIGb0603 TaxID=2940612 RepID=UPI0021684F9B|nr:translesion error-prone DNA polymerase V subunit UmuC [Rahnella sp. BIGb0603]MCS3424348.1 DNA polymerase V [Rahnella sp. BIGb0603]